MNKSLLVLVIILTGLASFLLGHYSSAVPFGATVNYSNSLGQTNLYNSLAGLLTDINAVRTPLAGINSTTTAAYGPVTLGPLGSTTSSAQITFTVSSAAVGDSVVFGMSTSTAFVNYTARVSAANTVTLTVLNASNTAQTPATSTYNLIILPNASFGTAPAALTTATSTSN